MRFGYKCLMRSAEIAGLDEAEQTPKKEKKNKKDAETVTEPTDAEVTSQEQTEAAPKEQDKSKASDEMSPMMKLLMVISTVLGFGLAIVLFVWLPAQIYQWLPDQPFAMDNRYLRSAFEGIFIPVGDEIHESMGFTD
jgi:uncharacterized protein YqhQ